MISTAIEMYLDTLAGYIFDEDKLVTYKWLSKELGLHVNLAKQILWHFWKEQDKRRDMLATFTLMGYFADGTFRVEVVKESELSSAKKKFRNLTGEHLYSLQRSLPDVELLALSGPGDIRQSAIVCKEIIPRKEEELFLLRWGSKFRDEKTAPHSTDKSSKPGLKPTFNEPKSTNIFGKANQGKSKPTKPRVLDIPKEPAARGRKRQGSGDHEAIGGKRQKRKFDGDSRSSEESSGNEEEEEEMARGPDEIVPGEDVAPSPPKYKIEGGKRRVRKVVDKTSTDENGYLVTKKEYVYESCSDAEEPDAPKVEPRKPQAALKANRKQASLLNFFKKS